MRRRSGQCSCAVGIPPWIYVDRHLEIFIRYEWDRFPSFSDLLVEWATALTSRRAWIPHVSRPIKKKEGFSCQSLCIRKNNITEMDCLSRSRSNDEESVVQWSPLISLPRDGSLAVSLNRHLMLWLWAIHCSGCDLYTVSWAIVLSWIQVLWIASAWIGFIIYLCMSSVVYHLRGTSVLHLSSVVGQLPPTTFFLCATALHCWLGAHYLRGNVIVKRHYAWKNLQQSLHNNSSTWRYVYAWIGAGIQERESVSMAASALWCPWWDICQS